MSLLLCFCTFLISYGTYNMLCYLFMLPTAAADNMVSVLGTGKKQSFIDQVSVLIAERVVKRWNLHLNNEKQLNNYLIGKGIDMNGTAYFISKLLKLAAGIMAFIPVSIINRYLFLWLFLFWIFNCALDLKQVFMNGKKVNFLKNKKMKKFFVSSFLWIYSISNIIMIVNLFT